MTLKPIIIAVLDIIEADTAIRAITGYTDADKRVYRYRQGEGRIDVAQGLRAFITYEAIAAPAESGGVTEPVLALSVWGPDVSDLIDIEDRLFTLLHGQDITIATGVTVRGTRIQSVDAADPRTDYDGREVHYKFGQLTA
jgi:hypothetical protein